MTTTTNKRKTNELKAYSVARWNGLPFHPDSYCEFHCDEIL